MPADSHTGKDLLEILETYPRDELFQVGADELLPVALGRPAPAGAPADPAVPAPRPDRPVLVALVYLPRDRYTTEVRLAMQQILLERLGGTSIEYTARSTESVLARLHFVVRRAGRPARLPDADDVDVEALQAELAAAARTWTDDLADALHARYGAEAERLLARVGRRVPRGLQGGLPRRAGRRPTSRGSTA